MNTFNGTGFVSFLTGAGRVVLVLLITLAVFWTILLDFLPPLEKDALIHHLAVPKLWLRAGGFVETPWAYFSYYPMNLELLYLIPLALGADWGAKIIHNFFGLTTALLLFLYLKKRLGLNWGLVGALIFLTTPMIMRLAVSANVDLGLAFFMTAAVLGLIWWRETGRRRFFVLSAIALGLGLGTKYNALIALPLLGLGLAGALSRRRAGTAQAIGGSAAYLGLALLVFSPWLVKNFLLTGNPIYPLYNGLWGLPAVTPAGYEFDLFTTRRFFYGESLGQVLLIPVRAFFQGQDFNPRFFDGVLNPGLILLPPLALIRPVAPEVRPLALLALLWTAVVFFQASFLVRYLVPILPILVILTVFGLKALWSALSKFIPSPAAAAVLALVLAAFLYPNAAWAAQFWSKLDPAPYLTGRENRQAYLTRRLDHYPAMDFINRHLPPTARVLFLFAGGRGYYCDRDYFYQTYYSGEVLRPILERAASWEDVRQGLQGLGATHVLTREGLLAEYLQTTFPPEKLRLWMNFSKNGWERLYQAKGYRVYAVK